MSDRNTIIAVIILAAIFIGMFLVFLTERIKENRKMEKLIKQSKDNLHNGDVLLKSIKPKK